MPSALVKHESTAVAEQEHQVSNDALFSLVTGGDCAKLKDDEKLMYYKARCEAAGLDPRTAPFQFINLKGKLVLYALKAATDQLAAKHGIRCEIVEQQTQEGVRTVTVRAITKDGRQTDEIGCVSVSNLKGDDLCNAYMKAVTKAKRRAVLSLCGLGLLDETELETIPGANPGNGALQLATQKKAATLAKRITPAVETTAVPPGGITDEDVASLMDEEKQAPLVAEAMQEAEKPRTNINKGKDWFKRMMGAFQEIKPIIGDDQYYRVLGQHGYEHANEFPSREAAMAAFKDMQQISKDIAAKK